MIRLPSIALCIGCTIGCTALSPIPEPCGDVREAHRPTLIEGHAQCSNLGNTELVNPVTGSFRWEQGGEVHGPWSVGIGFLSAGQQVQLSGCQMGPYAMCWSGAMTLDIGQRVEDEPLELEVGAGVTGVAAEQWTDTEVWFTRSPASGTATVTRYTPDDGRLSASLVIEPVDHADEALDTLYIDLDVEFTP